MRGVKDLDTCSFSTIISELLSLYQWRYDFVRSGISFYQASAPNVPRISETEGSPVKLYKVAYLSLVRYKW
jgi:hypothetical protein